MIYLTSDTHINHKSICLYSNRPFNSVEEMNEALIKNWNRVVTPNDTVYHLGDVSFGTDKQTFEYFERLNGKIHIILGNHDKVIQKNKDYLLKEGLVESIQEYKEINYNKHHVVLFHFPMRSWHRSHHGSIHCFAHCHNTMPPLGKSLDIGVDSTVITTEYRPVSIEEVIKWSEDK